MCDLPVIGTSRPPKASDLRERGLTGLPDPDPVVALLRAKLELDQAKLNAQVGAYYAERLGSSSLRTEIGTTEAEVLEHNGEATGKSGDVALESEAGEGREQNDMKLSFANVELSNMPELLAANELSNIKKAQRNLRVRNPIQLRPYGLEREEYRQTIKAGGTKARGKRV